jgi:peptidoglycan L-alanyl-D-glutamate endopeptidase CwlK
MSNKLKKKDTGFLLSNRSILNLKGVHPDLVKVVELALTKYSQEDFLVVQGLRTLAEQRRFVARGASKTMASRHLNGNAVDLAWWKNGNVSWNTDNLKAFYSMDHSVDYSGYQAIGVAMLQAGKDLGVPIRWGADWDGDGQHTDHTFLDWVHFELPKGSLYP